MLAAGRVLRHCATYLAFDPKGPEDEYVSVLPLPWIMGYDVEPLRTLESRRAMLRDAVAGGWLLLFEHDARVAYGRAVEAKGGAALADEVLAPGVAPA